MKKKMRDKFPAEKKELLEEMLKKMSEINTELEKINQEVDEIHKYIHSLKQVGKISASATIHSGVKIHIRDAHLEVKNELKRITFINEDSIIKTKKYEEPEEESFEED